MEYSKSWSQSLTIIAGAITAVSGLIVLVAKIVGIELLQDEIEQIIYAGIYSVLGVVTIYGRIRANSKIE